MRPRSKPAFRSCTSSTASAPRTRSRRSSRSRATIMRAMIDDELVLAHRARGMTPDRPDHPRHGPEPGRLLPGPRDGQQVLRGHARHRPEGHGQVRRADRPPVPPVRLRRRTRMPRRSSSSWARAPRRSTRRSSTWSRKGEKVGVLKVRLYRPFDAEGLRRGPAGHGQDDRRARPHQGAGRHRRAALPGRPHRHRRGHGRRTGSTSSGYP